MTSFIWFNKNPLFGVDTLKFGDLSDFITFFITENKIQKR